MPERVTIERVTSEQVTSEQVTSEQRARGVSLRVPMSREEWVALGETRHHEWSDGVLYVNPPDRWHVLVTTMLARRLDAVAPPGFRTYPEWGLRTVVGDFEPDLMVAPADLPDESYAAVPPLLVVEVGSPTTRDLDWERKFRAYAATGIGWYWIVERDEVTVFESVDGRFVERQRIGSGAPARTVGPVELMLDPASLTDL